MASPGLTRCLHPARRRAVLHHGPTPWYSLTPGVGIFGCCCFQIINTQVSSQSDDIRPSNKRTLNLRVPETSNNKFHALLSATITGDNTGTLLLVSYSVLYGDNAKYGGFHE